MMLADHNYMFVLGAKQQQPCSQMNPKDDGRSQLHACADTKQQQPCSQMHFNLHGQPHLHDCVSHRSIAAVQPCSQVNFKRDGRPLLQACVGHKDAAAVQPSELQGISVTTSMRLCWPQKCSSHAAKRASRDRRDHFGALVIGTETQQPCSQVRFKGNLVEPLVHGLL